MRALLFASLLACAPSPPTAAAPPNPPVLDALETPARRGVVTLHGWAPVETTLRLFTDAACAGPVLQQFPSSALDVGVEVNLVAYVENVFALVAVTKAGIASECSAPARTLSLPERDWSSFSVASTPTSPSRESHFVLKGLAPTHSQVRLYAGYPCDTAGPPLQTLSADDYFLTGFRVDVTQSSLFLAVEAADEAHSWCEPISLVTDLEAPSLDVRLASPSPSPQRSGYVVVQTRGESGVNVRITASPDCSGEPLNECSDCLVHTIRFPPLTTTVFSVLGIDSAGNRSCVVGHQPWTHEPTLPPGEAVVLLAGDDFQQPRAQVPVGRRQVEFFFSADCSGSVAARADTLDVLRDGLAWLLIRQPVLSARSVRIDGGLDPCSAPLRPP